MINITTDLCFSLPITVSGSVELIMLRDAQ